MAPISENCAELQYTQQLGDANVNIQSKALKKLKNFLNIKSEHKGFLYEDFIKIWKGLYYCMYMSDKPLVQEELAENISNLIHCICTNSQKILFFKASLDTLAREWNGIDKYRYDKFLMLVTRVIRQMLIFLSKISWEKGALKETCSILELHIICPCDDKNEKPQELKMHIADVILEELAKVGKEKLPDKVLIAVLHPFLKVLAMSKNDTYILHVTNRLLHTLIRQSKLGIKNNEDIASNEISFIQRKTKQESGSSEEESDEEIEAGDEDLVMDPRIGGVDVHLPFIRPNYNKVASAIESVAHNREISQQRRKNLFFHAKKFRLLSQGIYPFNFPEVSNHFKQRDVAKIAFKRLAEFDEQMSSKRSKTSDEEDIEDIENYQPEDPVKYTQNIEKKNDKISKKKEANIRRSLTLKNKKQNRRRKMNKYKNKPELLQKLLQKKEDNFKKSQEGKSQDNIDVKSKAFNINPPAKMNVKVKAYGQEQKSSSSGNVKSMKMKNKKQRLNKLKSLNNEDLKANSGAKFKTLKSKEGNKYSEEIENSFKIVSKAKRIASPKSLEKKLGKEDPWKMPLREGEIEFEVPKKNYSKKVKSAMLMRKTPNINTRGKTLKINLKNNTEHEFGDYKMAIEQSPEIPFSAKKKPLPSALKSPNTQNLNKKFKKKNSQINFIRRRSKL